ncbi:hypothetical protein T11_9581 [Trichinella zimbabwensis]|uniref:Uncharacterized protein n=1 Tax=Trichinella zimbabwensis TaxID=268475 RepID=A0A0V1HZK6_9BILA|nr:hypothetical protein T11_9581 [Trichinella zimbabwensis]
MIIPCTRHMQLLFTQLKVELLHKFHQLAILLNGNVEQKININRTSIYSASPESIYAAQQAKQSVIFVPQRSRLTLFGEKRNKRPKKIPQLLKSAKLKRKRNLPTRCSKSKNGNSLVGKIAPNDTEAIPRHNIEAFVRACIAPSLSSFFSIDEMNQRVKRGWKAQLSDAFE